MLSPDMFKYGRLCSNHAREALDTFKITLPLEDRYHNYGAFYQNSLVGLIIVCDKVTRYEVDYLGVLPLFRDQGAGSALLKLMVSDLSDKNIIGYFNSREHNPARLKVFLGKVGWNTRAYYNQFEVPLSDIPAFFIKKSLTQLEQSLSASSPIDLVGEDQLTPKNIDSIHKIMEYQPQFLNPFDIGSDKTPNLGIYACYDQDVVGWVPVKKCDNERLEVKCIFIDPNFRRYNLFTVMLGYVIQKSIGMGLGDMRFIFYNNPFNLRVNKIYAFYFKKAYENKITFFKVTRPTELPAQ